MTESDDLKTGFPQLRAMIMRQRWKHFAVITALTACIVVTAISIGIVAEVIVERPNFSVGLGAIMGLVLLAYNSQKALREWRK